MAGITSNYPASIDSESNIIPPNNGDTLTVPGHWLAGNNGPIINVQNELGTDPSGSFSTVKARLDDTDKNVITEVDMWYLTSSFTQSGEIDITNVTRYWADYKGAGMSQSSGVFTFPSTGYWLINYNMHAQYQDAGNNYIGSYIRYSTDSGLSYNVLISPISAVTNNQDYAFTSGMVYIPVLNASTYRVIFQVVVASPSSALFSGSRTNMTFIKLGDL